MSAEAAHRVLAVRVGSRTLAVPLASVIETMRPLPVEPFAGTPGFIRGLAVIRGIATPVVDVAELLGGGDGHAPDDGDGRAPGRYVTLRIGARQAALAVDEVLGLRGIEPAVATALPPLLEEAAGGAVESVALLDAELVFVLRATRLVPDELWRELEAHEPATPAAERR